MTDFTLSANFIYLAAFDNVGQRTSLRYLQSQVSNGVYGVDLDPGCYAPPLRCFVEATDEGEATEAIIDYAFEHPEDKIGRNVLQPCSGETCWCEDGKFSDSRDTAKGQYHVQEGVFIHIERVKLRGAIASAPGGWYQRKVQAVYKDASLEYRKDGQAGYEICWSTFAPGEGLKVHYGPATPCTGYRGGYKAWQLCYDQLRKDGAL